MEPMRLTENEVAKVTAFMRDECGNDCSDKATLVGSKMGRLCERLGYHRFYDFWDDAMGHSMAAARLRQRVIDELTTNYSFFHREPEHFTRLSALIESGELPVGAGDLAVAASKLRVWSAGCASGEEPYSIAMALSDEMAKGYLPAGFHVVGSDISQAAIDVARDARYDVADAARLPTTWRSRYCMRSGHYYEVKGRVTEHVEFRVENVLAPRPDAPFDLVMCRNMIIYFEPSAVRKLCRLLRVRVKPGGYLFCGHTEILSDLEGFTYLEPSIWQRDAEPADSLFANLA